MQVVATREELLDILRAKGYDVTQATYHLIWSAEGSQNTTLNGPANM